MDRGIPSEALLAEMRERQVFYLVGTPRSKVAQHAQRWLDQPWQQVRDSVRVKLFEHEGELWVLAESQGRRTKEIAIRRKRLARLLRKLRAMRHSLPSRDRLLLRLGAAKKEAGRAFGLVKIHVPAVRSAVRLCVAVRVVWREGFNTRWTRNYARTSSITIASAW